MPVYGGTRQPRVRISVVLWVLAGLSVLMTPNARETAVLAQPVPSKPAKWTIMVYLNGDNDLEEAAFENFRQMAAVGGTDAVRIIVLFDRSGWVTTNPHWNGTLLFDIKPGTSATPEQAVHNYNGSLNMGSGAVLERFVATTMHDYPAEHFMLVMWDHGQGWRAPSRTIPLPDEGGALPEPTPANSRTSTYRALSYDATNDDRLYNSELADALQRALKGKKLDIIGFDSCLMAMVETAYSFRDVAQVLVGSEELEPGEGWKYDEWLTPLVKQPSLDKLELAKTIVDTYGRYYERQQVDRTTQSAIILSNMNAVAAAITTLANALTKHLYSQFSKIQKAREGCEIYGQNSRNDGINYFFHIDLIRFCEQLIANMTEADSAPQKEIRAAALVTKQRLGEAIKARYAGEKRHGSFGSNGLAIYFPSSLSQYQSDVFSEGGYEKKNDYFPVAFVRKTTWPDFLHTYLARAAQSNQ